MTARTCSSIAQHIGRDIETVLDRLELSLYPYSHRLYHIHSTVIGTLHCCLVVHWNIHIGHCMTALIVSKYSRRVQWYLRELELKVEIKLKLLFRTWTRTKIHIKWTRSRLIGSIRTKQQWWAVINYFLNNYVIKLLWSS